MPYLTPFLILNRGSYRSSYRAAYRLSRPISLLQYFDADKDKFNIAGHEDDELFKNAFFKKMLHSFCNPG